MSWRARRFCCCSTTRPGTSRAARCCPAPPGAWGWSPAALGLLLLRMPPRSAWAPRPPGWRRPRLARPPARPGFGAGAAPAAGPRYRLHALLREHAGAVAAADDAAEPGEAAGRLRVYSCHAALPAARHFPRRASAYRRPPTSRRPGQAPDISTLGQAAAWLE